MSYLNVSRRIIVVFVVVVVAVVEAVRLLAADVDFEADGVALVLAGGQANDGSRIVDADGRQ